MPHKPNEVDPGKEFRLVVLVAGKPLIYLRTRISPTAASAVVEKLDATMKAGKPVPAEILLALGELQEMMIAWALGLTRSVH